MGLHKKTIQARGEALSVRAATVPDSWNEEMGSVEVVFATRGALALRYKPEIGDFYEELGLDESEIDLRRLNDAGPVLNAHGEMTHAHESTPGLESQVGTVLDAWTTGSDARAMIRIIDRPDLLWVRQGVARGDFKKISAGYRVHRWVWTGEEKNGLPIYRAVSWTPHEISLLPIAEDAGALVRSPSAPHIETFEPPESMALHTKRTARGATQTPAQAGGTETETTQSTPEEVTGGGEAETRSAAGAAAAVETPAQTQEAAETQGTPAALPAGELETRSLGGTPDAGRIATAAVQAERNRVAEIGRLGALQGIPDGQGLATRAIAEGTSAEAFRNAAFEAMAASDLSRPETVHGTQTQGLSVGQTGQSKELRAMQAGLDYRCGAAGKIEDGAQNFVGRTLLDLAAISLRHAGLDPTNYSRDEIIRRAMSTGDFPLLLANTANKRVVNAYEGVPRTFVTWARRSVANDFKARSLVRLGAGSAPVQIPETGEIPLGKLTEGGESYRLFEYGRRLALTRQMLINDDTATLDSIPARMGARMAELEGDVVYALLISNPTLSDGNAAFSAAHGNIGTGDVSTSGFSTMRVAMRKQTDEDGAKINVTPRHIVVPPELETEADRNTVRIQSVEAAGVNVFTGKFDSIAAEPRLTEAVDWYGFANPALTESIEYAYLAGNETPTVLLEEQFSTSGREIRITHAFGAGWADWRGAYKSDN